MTISRDKYTYTEDVYIKKISNFTPEKALELGLKRFSYNKGKDLGDYKQLMYIYIDLGDYEKVINLGKIALFLMNKYKVKVIGIHAILSKMVQAYLFSGQIKEAETIINKYSDVEMFFEKFILEYKKGNYYYLIDNYNNIKNDKRHYIGWELFLLAKTYLVICNFDKSIEIYKELYEYGNFLENENSLLATYYLYISSFNLFKIYFEQGNYINSDFYNFKFLFYKNRIDNEELCKIPDNTIMLNYNRELMYNNINRIELL